jgi:glycolate oxidase iron-sulfur subunit
MQTSILPRYLETPEGQEADAILRSCVHCGFCTATCPTYRVLGDELDGPRGRIYLIKQLLEGGEVSRRTQAHLDRCLTCRSCETTCPSGVRYARLADIGRGLLERQVRRPWHETLARRALRAVFPYPERVRPLLRAAQAARPLLPRARRATIPERRREGDWPQPRHARRMLVLEGCVQSVAAPETNAAAARVLDRLGISLVRLPTAGCCGAMSQHLSAEEEARGFMRRNVDAWWPEVEAGAEAVVVSASGCGAVVRQYGELLGHEPAYAARARSISRLTRDLSEVLAAEDLTALQGLGLGRRIAFHAPCSLQHGLRLAGVVETLLGRLGFTLTPVPDAHLCCGSAGTYSLLQPRLSRRLLSDKLAALHSGGPELIATANIGCQMHLSGAASVPVRHWIELLDRDALPVNRDA